MKTLWQTFVLVVGIFALALIAEQITPLKQFTFYLNLGVFLGLIGLSLAACGMLGYFFVIGPPLVKLVCAGTLVYAASRTIWSFWQA